LSFHKTVEKPKDRLGKHKLFYSATDRNGFCIMNGLSDKGRQKHVNFCFLEINQSSCFISQLKANQDQVLVIVFTF